ncbi:MAG: hypothetical protein J7L71_11645 [Spirochaetaceae bacterium]|nr:hypothetical protein [Spirochaetaceae bacterium]
MSDDIFSGEIDPEIAALMDIDEVEDLAPDFEDLFSDGTVKKQTADKVDLTKEAFSPIIKFSEDRTNPLFSSKEFYKSVLSGEGESSKRVHSLLSQFLNASDPKDKSMYRAKLISATWNLASSIVSKFSSLTQPKKFFLRYGFLLPTLVSREQRESIGKIVVDNNSGEPFYYFDEWLNKVANGQISTSAVDEVKQVRNNQGAKIRAQIEKAKGTLEFHLGEIQNRIRDIENAEEELREKSKILSSHQIYDDGLKVPYDAGQKNAISDIMNVCRLLTNKDKELGVSFTAYENAQNQLTEFEQRANQEGVSSGLNSKTLESEFNTVRQMIKMVIGRQGNHIPFLMKQYFRSNIRDIGTRENVIMEFAAVEAIDEGLFKRTFKRQTNRIVPYVILVPGYGERGICWEPFEKFNRATSRGRVAIPIFPKDLKIAVISAAADLRWQVAKEKSQHYWMEEGLTGRYYQWFTEKKMRGDVRESFIQDYLLWITKESEGTQKLDKDVRGIFWRNIPFRQELRDNLRKRGFVYNELYKKDVNRSLSDGY